MAKLESIFKVRPNLDATTALGSGSPTVAQKLLRIVDALPMIVVSKQIDKGQFEPKPKGLKELLDPKEYGLDSLRKQRIGEDGKLGLWASEIDPNLPTIVAFHGNTGTWGDLGIPKPVTDTGMMKKVYGNRHPEEHESRWYRQDLLLAWQEKKVNIIAVHPPGFGLSDELTPSEESFQQANEDVIALLKEKGIKGEDVIVMGESLGGSQAAMFATQMTVNHNRPPKTLSLVATPANFARAAADFAEFMPVVGKQVAKLIARNPQALTNNFDLSQLFHQLDKEKTTISIQQPIRDWVVPPHHSGMNKEEAQGAGLTVHARMIKGGHTTRDAKELVENTWQVHNGKTPASRPADASLTSEVVPFSERVQTMSGYSAHTL